MLSRLFYGFIALLVFSACSTDEPAEQMEVLDEVQEATAFDPLDATVRQFNDDDEIHMMVHGVFDADTAARDQFFAEVAAANMRGDIAILGRPLRIVIEDGKESIKGLDLTPDELHGSYHHAVDAMIAKADKEEGGELTEEEVLIGTQK